MRLGRRLRGSVTDGLPDNTGDNGGSFNDGHFRYSSLDSKRVWPCASRQGKNALGRTLPQAFFCSFRKILF
jgi:hypothetical protein